MRLLVHGGCIMRLLVHGGCIMRSLVHRGCIMRSLVHGGCIRRLWGCFTSLEDNREVGIATEAIRRWADNETIMIIEKWV